MDESRLTSTVPVVLEAMEKNLAELTTGMAQGGGDVKVMFAMKADSRSSDDIHIGDIEDHFTVVPTMKAGRKAREETYHVVINIFCSRHDVHTANRACLDLYEVIENWFAENPDLGLDIPTLRVTEVRSSLNMTYDNTQDWRSHLTVRPFVQCRLR